MTYHQAKGLTFDSVFLPRLNQSSFQGKLNERIRHLCFVGVSRAVKWVYMSGKNQALIAPMQVLGQNTTHRFLETMISTEAIGLLSPARMDDSHQAVSDTYGLD